MNDKNSTQAQAISAPQTRGQRFSEWLQDPLGGVIAASVSTIGAFGMVLGGTFFIHTVMG